MRGGSCEKRIYARLFLHDASREALMPELLALKHKSRILGHSSNPVCGFSMIEQVRLCAVWGWRTGLALP